MAATSASQRSVQFASRQESPADTGVVTSKLRGELANLWNNAIIRSIDEFRDVETKRLSWQHLLLSQVEQVLTCVMDIKQGFQGLQQQMQTVTQAVTRVDTAKQMPRLEGSKDALVASKPVSCGSEPFKPKEREACDFQSAEDMIKKVETTMDKRLEDMQERLEEVANMHVSHILRLNELMKNTEAHRQMTEQLETKLAGQMERRQHATVVLPASDMSGVLAEIQAADVSDGDPLVKFNKMPQENHVEDDHSPRAHAASPRATVAKAAPKSAGQLAFSRLHSHSLSYDLQQAKDPAEEEENRVQNLLQYVQRVSFVLIVINTIYMGITNDVLIRRHLHGDSAGAVYYELGELFFTGAFILEIVLRLTLERRAFFIGKNAFWNFFDSVVVIFQIWQTVNGSLGGIGFLRFGRFARLVRTARMLRTIQHFRIFRLLVDPEVWQPLLVGCASLICFLYLGALIVTSGMADAIEERGPEGLPNGLVHLYGSVFKTMVTLFFASTGHESWGVLSKPLDEAAPWLQWVLLVYIFIMIFGLMNTVAAMYVDAFMHRSSVDRLTTDQNASDKAALSCLRGMMLHKPVKAGNLIRFEDVNKLLLDEGAPIIKKLGFEIGIARALLKLLDGDDKGMVEIDEFIYGLLNLKGNPQSIYLATTQSQCKKMINKINRLTTLVEEQLVLVASLHNGNQKIDLDRTSDVI